MDGLKLLQDTDDKDAVNTGHSKEAEVKHVDISHKNKAAGGKGGGQVGHLGHLMRI